MRAFAFAAPTTVEEAVALLAKYGDEAHALAGGTALVLLLKNRLMSPALLVGLHRIPGLAGVRETEAGGLQIGPLTVLRRVELDPLVRLRAALLAQTIHRVANVRVRNQATLGGNLVHADPALDPPPALLALDASVVLAAADGNRTVPLDQFNVDLFQTAIRRDELLTAITIPPQPPTARFSFVKFVPRTVDDFATVTVAVRIVAAPDGRVEDARIALGAAAAVPFRAKGAEAALRGRRADRAAIGEVAALTRDASAPLPDIRGSADYKREMVRVWTMRALEKATGTRARV